MIAPKFVLILLLYISNSGSVAVVAGGNFYTSDACEKAQNSIMADVGKSCRGFNDCRVVHAQYHYSGAP